MENPTKITISINVFGQSGGVGGDTYLLDVEVRNSDGINFAEAVNEIRQSLKSWATSFLKYDGTISVKLYPGGKRD